MVDEFLGATGRRLWADIHEAREVPAHMSVLVLNACRIADRLDDVCAELARSSLTVENQRGDEVANPLLVELRMQASTFSSLMSKLGVDKLAVLEKQELSFEERLAQASEALKNPELRVVR